MRKLTIVFLLITSVAFGQELIKRDLGSYKELKVYSGLEVELIASDASRIEISGEQAENVLVKTTNETLRISFNFTRSISHDDVRIRVFYKNPIMLVDANEGSSITSKDTFIQNYIEIRAQEGATIDLGVRVKQLDIKTVSGSVIRLNGVAENSEIEATTGAIYYGYHVKNADAKVESLSGGRVEVTSDGILDAYVRLGGSIFYRGTPEVLKTKKVLGGTIKEDN